MLAVIYILMCIQGSLIQHVYSTLGKELHLMHFGKCKWSELKIWISPLEESSLHVNIYTCTHTLSICTQYSLETSISSVPYKHMPFYCRHPQAWRTPRLGRADLHVNVHTFHYPLLGVPLPKIQRKQY